ncbi:hypothetical protein [Hyalangium versicolor]|uniref:hypothetical protein n=1 Tax=Hyalangium versicolor TaxID=2861190 RepID=UPI001CCEBE07|nr:hypothetical protein [Hyalangium versicolor]
MSSPLSTAKQVQEELPGAKPAHEELLARYLSRLHTDPALLAAASQAGREQTLQWAADELKHTAATLGHIPLADAEYELERVLQEVMERLDVA